MYSKAYELPETFTTEEIDDPLESYLFRSCMSLYSGRVCDDWGISFIIF